MTKLVYRGNELKGKAANTNVQAAQTDLTYRGHHNDHKAPIASKGGNQGQTYRGARVK